MLDIEIGETNVALLIPKGALGHDDFGRLTTAINSHINENDVVPNLVIAPNGLPHWDSITAMLDHVKFVRDHHRLVKKVAIVGDQLAFKVLPYIADHFVAAKIRHFPAARFDEAMQWAEASEDHPGGFDLIDGLPSDVIAIEAHGIVTSQDYRDMLVPLVEEKLKVHDRIKVLIVVGARFISYSAGAAWDDTRFGFSHWGDFGKIALVTDLGWLSHAAKLFAPLMRGGLHVFATADLDDAKAWIKT